jgi:hypothetical protein
VDVFPDVNPCTGDPMTVTIATRGFEHPLRLSQRKDDYDE